MAGNYGINPSPSNKRLKTDTRPTLARKCSTRHYISSMKAPSMTAKQRPAKGPKPVYVYLKKGRHRTQPWTFIIDEPGVGPVSTKRERYARKFTAKRGALRMLGAVQFGTTLSGRPMWIVRGKNVRPVTFVTLN